jgi:hypothetical protein
MITLEAESMLWTMGRFVTSRKRMRYSERQYVGYIFSFFDFAIPFALVTLQNLLRQEAVKFEDLTEEHKIKDKVIADLRIESNALEER